MGWPPIDTSERRDLPPNRFEFQSQWHGFVDRHRPELGRVDARAPAGLFCRGLPGSPRFRSADTFTWNMEHGMTQGLLRPLGIGEILDGAFVLYRRHFAVLVGTTLIAFLPVALMSMLLILFGVEVDPMAVESVGTALDMVLTGLGMILTSLVSMGGMMISLGALTHQLAEAHAGREITIVAGLREGLRRVLTVFGSVVAANLIIASVIIVPGVLLAILIPLATAGGGAGSGVGMFVITIVTILAILIGMSYLATSYFALVPAVIVEGLGTGAALRRSWQLARGGRLRILTVFGICWVITILPLMGIMVVTGMGMAFWDPDSVEQMMTSQIYMQNVVGSLVGALTLPILLACLVLLYFDRRIRQEGYDLEAAADALAIVE